MLLAHTIRYPPGACNREGPQAWRSSSPRLGARLRQQGRRHAVGEAQCLDVSSYETERLLRQCLTRHLLQRIADSPPEARLEHLGISRLSCPPTPPPLAALGDELRRCATREAALAALARRLGPPEPYLGYQTPSGKRCLLAPGEAVQRLRDPRLEAALARLFAAIQQQRAPLVTLGPHCLFHAHLFLHTPWTAPGLAPDAALRPDSGRRFTRPSRGEGPHPKDRESSEDSGVRGGLVDGFMVNAGAGGGGGGEHGGGLGLLFHACEYPAWHPESFPFRLGHCQEGSGLVLQPRQLERRNLLWYQGRLLQLDVSPGLPLRSLLWPDTAPLATLYEEDWGLPLVDLTLDMGPLVGNSDGSETDGGSSRGCGSGRGDGDQWREGLRDGVQHAHAPPAQWEAGARAAGVGASGDVSGAKVGAAGVKAVAVPGVACAGSLGDGGDQMDGRLPRLLVTLRGDSGWVAAGDARGGGEG